VPGTVAGAAGAGADIDGRDWWFRTAFDATGDERAIVFDGVATICEVYLNGELAASGDSMFLPVTVDVAGRLRPAANELAVCCRALAPRLAERRRPRARWRTALVAEGNLRFHRTMLLGRAPGFAPGPPVAGIWRAVRIERGPAQPRVRLRPRVTGAGEGILAVTVEDRAEGVWDGPLSVRLVGPTGVHEGLLGESAGVLTAELRIPDVARWWPHTHGEPVLYDVAVLAAGGEPLHRARVGFRELAWPADWERDGLSLRINGTEIFCRGAVWTPPSLTAPDASDEELRAVLARVRGAGMNMLRIPGVGCYESDAFHDLCDELGILVWQDFMFANLDYPDTDPSFIEAVEAEARHQLGRLAGRPSLAVLCGGSECAQQVTMLGLDPELARGPLYTEILPRLVTEAGAEVPFVPNAPWGGNLPFRPAQGVANYYGVGAYRRPLADARAAGVRFAAECLAFSNVPDDEELARILAGSGSAAPMPVPHLPAWKAGVPRDAGAGWDFEDVRDHYVGLVYGVDPTEVRWADPERYLRLGAAATGEVMAETFGEWRRAASPCAGALVLWLRDLLPGAGWGLLDSAARPKAALHHLRRALAPVAVWITDEGLAGMAAHVANDTATPVRCRLRVALYRDGEVRVEEATADLALAPHEQRAFDIESLIGRFVDINWSYRFGPPAQDLVFAGLETGPEPGEGLISTSWRFPVGRPIHPQSAAALGLDAHADRVLGADGALQLRLCARRVVHGLRIDAPGYVAADDALTLEPGVERRIMLAPESEQAGGDRPTVTLTALNLADRLRIRPEPTVV
jgi:beta-mannosidase